MTEKDEVEIANLMSVYQSRLGQISWTQKDHQSAVDLHLTNASSAMLLLNAAIRGAYRTGVSAGFNKGVAFAKAEKSQTGEPQLAVNIE